MGQFLNDPLDVAANTAFGSYVGPDGEGYAPTSGSGSSNGTVADLAPSEDELRGPMNSGMYCTTHVPSNRQQIVIADFYLRTRVNATPNDRFYAIARFDLGAKTAYAAGFVINGANQMVWNINKWTNTALSSSAAYTTIAGDDFAATSATTPQLASFSEYTLKFVCEDNEKSLWYKARGADDSTYVLVCINTTNNDYTSTGFVGVTCDGTSSGNASARHLSAFDSDRADDNGALFRLLLSGD